MDKARRAARVARILKENIEILNKNVSEEERRHTRSKARRSLKRLMRRMK